MTLLREVSKTFITGDVCSTVGEKKVSCLNKIKLNEIIPLHVCLPGV